MNSIDYIEDIIRNDLCVRCGTCIAICPKRVYELDKDSLFPVIVRREDCNNCLLCEKVCPGREANFRDFHKNLFGTSFDPKNVNGCYKNIYIAHACEEEIRNRSSSGGVATAILIGLLEEQMIDAAVVVGMKADDPTRPTGVIARSREEILNAAQSKYAIVAPNVVLSEIRKKDERFAFVGLPCQVHALQKWLLIDKRMRKNLVFIIGLYCCSTLSQESAPDLLHTKKIRKNDVKKLQYRAGSWPGGIEVTLKDDRQIKLHASNIKDGAFVYLRHLYYIERCLMCIDGSCEFSDISLADPWIKQKGGWLYESGWTITLSRTDRAEEILKKLAEKGYLHIEKMKQEYLDMSQTQMVRQKRRRAQNRIIYRSKRGLRVPSYGYQIGPKDRKIKPRDLIDYSFRFLGRNRFTRQAATWFLYSGMLSPLIEMRSKMKGKK
ncbi:MAG: Coenzyme F420 hydrogenase/dehydrogenase, beta subunit C-terminal domain [Actinobacteria bacterium]|nr:Coenzyme F420 hydrogenase/dehydrogenase, beta subunit C-terminal domain [Actinomycetota bacterium]